MTGNLTILKNYIVITLISLDYPGSFLDFCRCYHIVNGQLKQRLRLDTSVVSIGVRYGSEMRDTFVGQLASMNMPHCTREQLQGAGDDSCGFDYVQCIIGFISYLNDLVAFLPERRLPTACYVSGRVWRDNQ